MSARTLLRRTAVASVLWLLMDAALEACPVCFQIENGRAAMGVRAGVVVLVAVTAAVVGGCAAFFARLIQRQ
jgi:hypothetical protein